MIQETAMGEEIILGIKKTPEFDHVIMFGKGGTNVENEKDISFRVLPVTKKDVNEMLKEVKFYKILEEKQVDTKAIVELIIKLGTLVKKYPFLSELDLNPVFISSKGSKLVDARIVFEE